MLVTSDEIAARLAAAKGWSARGNALVKEFAFADFLHALAFVNAVALPAEQLNHHPDITLHSWNKVTLVLSTHSEGGITELDFTLLRRIEGLL